MRSTGNFFSTRRGSSNHTLLVPLVACAVGAAASGAVILSQLGSPKTQPGVSSISPRAIVRNVGASEPTKTAQDRPIIETPLRPAVTSAYPAAMSWSLKRKQSQRASNRENIASKVRANDIGKDDLHALFRRCHALALGETNGTAPLVTNRDGKVLLRAASRSPAVRALCVRYALGDRTG